MRAYSPPLLLAAAMLGSGAAAGTIVARREHADVERSIHRYDEAVGRMSPAERELFVAANPQRRDTSGLSTIGTAALLGVGSLVAMRPGASGLSTAIGAAGLLVSVGMGLAGAYHIVAGRND